MAAAGLPALKGITGSTGRTGAINGLMSALDQARSAAILGGTNSYVAFPDTSLAATATLNPTNYIFRSYAIFRDANPDLGETNPSLIQIGKWESLPQGIALVSTSVTSLPQASLAISLPGSTSAPVASFRIIGFNSAGGLLAADATNGVTVYEGYWNGSQGVPARTNRIVDRITLNRFTGRAFLSVATNSSGTY